MATHEGVSCDVCGQSSFRGPRYKCLRCYDYDLCSACFDANRFSNRHALTHPMQCILTRFDCEIFYMGESVASSEAGIESFTCPFCGTLGFTRSSLAVHVTEEHADTEALVICPVCASHPTGDPNYQTPDMGRHLAYDHPPSVGSENGGEGGSAPAQSAHLFSRALAGGSVGVRSARRVGRGGGGGGGGGQDRPCPTTVTSSSPANRTGRARPSTTSTGGPADNSSPAMDPIAELLSHLSTVRSRAAMPLVSGGGGSGGGVGGSGSATNQAMNLQLAQLELQLAETTQAVQMANAVLAGNRAALASRLSAGAVTGSTTTTTTTTTTAAAAAATDGSAKAGAAGREAVKGSSGSGEGRKRKDDDLVEETSRIDSDLLLAQYLNSVDRCQEELAYQLSRSVFLEELLLESSTVNPNIFESNADLHSDVPKSDSPS